MSDHCYMSITCRHIDQSRFERLGFVVEYAEDEESAVTEMVDAEANHGHCEKCQRTFPITAHTVPAIIMVRAMLFVMGKNTKMYRDQ